MIINKPVLYHIEDSPTVRAKVKEICDEKDIEYKSAFDENNHNSDINLLDINIQISKFRNEIGATGVFVLCDLQLKGLGGEFILDSLRTYYPEISLIIQSGNFSQREKAFEKIKGIKKDDTLFKNSKDLLMGMMASVDKSQEGYEQLKILIEQLVKSFRIKTKKLV